MENVINIRCYRAFDNVKSMNDKAHLVNQRCCQKPPFCHVIINDLDIDIT